MDKITNQQQIEEVCNLIEFVQREISQSTTQIKNYIHYLNTEMIEFDLFLKQSKELDNHSLSLEEKIENAEKLLSRVARYEKSNLYVMANGFSRNEDIKVDVRNIYNSFHILKEYFKYIFIDIDTENEKLYDEVIANADVVWMLAQPSVSMFEKIKQHMEALIIRKTVRVVLNKYEKKYEPNLEKFQSILGKPIYCKIPKNFMAVGSAQTSSKTLKEVAPDINIVRAYMSLAKHIASKG